MNKLRPLALCPETGVIHLVCNREIPDLPKVHAIYPPVRLTRLFGQTPARLLIFAREAIRLRPDFVGGYHLLVNGLVAQLVASLTASKSLYFCGGGPKEVIGGGYRAEPWFSKLKKPDAVVERQLLKAVGAFDCVIVKGSQAVRFFRDRGVTTRFGLIPGGIDSAPLRYDGEEKSYDLILVARLYSSKRVDVFLRTLALLRKVFPAVRAVIVGSGELEGELRKLAAELELAKNLEFAGHQEDVGWWLKRSRIFVLTSENEGLSMALVEAMMAGLPAVVPDVGELAECVQQGVNGFVVRDANPESFARNIQALLEDRALCDRFSKAAEEGVSRFDLKETAEAWSVILRELSGTRASDTVSCPVGVAS